MEIPVQTLSNNKQIMGMMHIPTYYAKGKPIILIIYGLDGNQVELHRLAVKLGREAEKNGIVVMRFDFIGCGISEGEFWETNIDEKINDALKQIDFLEGCNRGVLESLFILGISDGTKVACKIANRDKRVKGMCLCSPVLVSEDTSNVLISSRLCREPRTKKIVYPFFGLWMGTQYLRDTVNDTFLDDFLAYKGPVLCTVGGRDPMVSQFRKLICEQCNNEIEVRVIKDADHIYNKSEWSDEVILRIIAWTKKQAK